MTASDATLSLTLMPHRSLGRKGLSMVILMVGVLCLVPAAIFLSMGAWPVSAFLGLDILLVAGAFWWNFRAARACEVVVLTPDMLTVRRVKPSGEQSIVQLNPYWAKLHVTETEDGVQSITVASQRQSVRIGQFLPPTEKDEVLGLLKDGLRRYSQFPV